MVVKVTCLVIPTHLEIASIFPKAHGEGSLINNALLMQHIVNRLKPVNIHARALCTKTKNPIGFLAIKVLSFCLNTSKCILKHFGRVLIEVESIFYNIALVAAALSVALIEPAAVLVCTAAVYLVAVVQLEVFRLFRVVEIVYMVTAHTWLAEVFARNGGNT